MIWSNCRKAVALTLALLLLALPAVGGAAANFEPGTLFQTLLSEVYGAGRQVETAIRLQLDSLPQVAPEEFTAMQKIVAGMEIRVSAVDDIDQKFYTLTAAMEGAEIFSVLAKADREGIHIASNLLPGITLLVPPSMQGALPIGLAPASEEKSEDMIAFENAYINYFVILGAWVSQKQTDREDLYVYEEAEGMAAEGSETRDPAELIMRSRVRPDDLKVLLRAMADQFYADDATQQAVANMFKGYGVTRADVRRWADQLPLWIAHDLNPTDNPTDFAVSYDGDGAVVGFDGVMPAMYDKFFFENGTLQYDRKTSDEDVIHRAQGEAAFAGGRKLTGQLQKIEGAAFEDMVENELSVSLNVPIPNRDTEVQVDLYGQETYQAFEGDVEILDGTGKADVAPKGLSRLHVEYAVHGETKMTEDYDIAHQTEVQVDAVLPNETSLGLTLTYDIASKEYETLELPAGNEVFDLGNLGADQRTRLEQELTALPISFMFQLVGALPPEAMSLIMG